VTGDGALRSRNVVFRSWYEYLTMSGLGVGGRSGALPLRAAKGRFWIAVFVAALALIFACGGDDDDGGSGTSGAPTESGAMEFGSPAFASGETLAAAYTCDGEDASPPLRWEGVPDDAQALAVEMVDPDADGFVHWLIFDIAADSGGVTANVPLGAETPEGAKQAINTFGEMGYGGPCPPEGTTHEYVFRLYALDAELGLDGGGSARNVQDALAEHTLAMSEVTGTYGR